MKLKPLMTAAALAATTVVAGLSAASAQTITASSPTMTGSDYFYTFTVTDSSYALFSFSDTSVTVSSSPVAPLDLTPGSFYFGSIPTTSVFTFESMGAPATGDISVTAANNVSLIEAPLAATPEPSAMVSMSILGACLGLGILAKRRKATTN